MAATYFQVVPKHHWERRMVVETMGTKGRENGIKKEEEKQMWQNANN